MTNLSDLNVYAGNGSGLTSLNGTNISSGTVSASYLPSAGAAASGIVSTGTQTFAGVKTFSSDPKMDHINESTSGHGVLITGRTSVTAIEAGYVGEVIEVTRAAALGLSGGSTWTLASFDNYTSPSTSSYFYLGAGQWSVSATIYFAYGADSNRGGIHISSVSSGPTVNLGIDALLQTSPTGSTDGSVTIPSYIIRLSSAAARYLYVWSNGTTGTYRCRVTCVRI